MGFEGKTAPKINDWTIVPEYSACLIEAVSRPYSKKDAITQSKQVPELKRQLELQLQRALEAFPKLKGAYTFSLEMDGASPSNAYLNLDGTVISDQDQNEAIILPECIEYDQRGKSLITKIGAHTEKGVGIYNHFNSCNITTHPAYSGDSRADLTRYVTFVEHLDEIFQKYKDQDKGTQHIVRNNTIHEARDNVRDIFINTIIREFQPQRAPDTFSEVVTSKEVLSFLENYFSEKEEDADTYFKEWYTTDYKPRVIPNIGPLVEIKGFGSNIALEALPDITSDLVSRGL
jgi:hypothetical protein